MRERRGLEREISPSDQELGSDVTGTFCDICDVVWSWAAKFKGVLVVSSSDTTTSFCRRIVELPLGLPKGQDRGEWHVLKLTIVDKQYNCSSNQLQLYNKQSLQSVCPCVFRVFEKPPRKLAITEVELREAVIYAYIPMFGCIFCTVHAYYIEREAAGSTNTRLGFCLPGDLQPRSQNNALHPKRHYFYTKSMIAITITHHFSILKG
jgi:hypothetical protein